jgi:hypothetical protein
VAYRRHPHLNSTVHGDVALAEESLALVLERIAPRLGPERVLRPVVTDDHRVVAAGIPRAREVDTGSLVN